MHAFLTGAVPTAQRGPRGLPRPRDQRQSKLGNMTHAGTVARRQNRITFPRPISPMGASRESASGDDPTTVKRVSCRGMPAAAEVAPSFRQAQ